ncbi:hypothetical protein CPLU01_00097 [Colletotrichum plurivorum]|uniref:Uncharacterized protein n=1 Tax=Colletotrichum plurivorum TaxID=2175906 RepID=A0A8H6NTA7_9PEZI|nr:hypothetical protein CPLU01_00097 [Colletotrichum plurivorum]
MMGPATHRLREPPAGQRDICPGRRASARAPEALSNGPSRPPRGQPAGGGGGNPLQIPSNDTPSTTRILIDSQLVCPKGPLSKGTLLQDPELLLLCVGVLTINPIACPVRLVSRPPAHKRPA